MQNYSESWRHLKSILAGYNERNYRPEPDDYSSHMQAKALSIFLINATLATPVLDRATVDAVLAGAQKWPQAEGCWDTYQASGLELTFLEDLGIVTFYADWCVVQCQRLNHTENVDASLISLVEAIEHLKDISYGRNGYVQPHYACPVDEFQKHLSLNFGATPVVELLPQLSLEDGEYKLASGNQNFDSLVSTYLWQALRESLSPELAFNRWLTYLRVNCSWGMPVLLEYLEFDERQEFSEQLIAYLAKDTALSKSMGNVWRQYIAAERLAYFITPQESEDFSAENRDPISKKKSTKIFVPTLSDLKASYPSYGMDDWDDLLVAKEWLYFRRFEPAMFYEQLISTIIESSIRIEGELLASYGNIERLLEMSKTRPVLKHILLHVLPKNSRSKYLIWLLSRPDTCDIALLYLSQNSPAQGGRDSKAFTLHLDTAYQELVCGEYLRTITGLSKNISSSEANFGLLKIINILAERCSFIGNDFSTTFEYLFLRCIFRGLSDKQIVNLTNEFVSQSPTLENFERCRSEGLHWYLLAFWLIERLEDAHAPELTTSLKDRIVAFYSEEFISNISGKLASQRRRLQPSTFFVSLSWHRLFDEGRIGALISLSNDCCEWSQLLHESNSYSIQASSAIRQYLQILMCLGRFQLANNERERITYRVTEIVRTTGFSKVSSTTSLFHTFYSDQYNLWAEFCSYANLLPDSLYDEFIERRVSLIPLNQLHVLLEHCIKNSQVEKLKAEIASRPVPQVCEIGLSGLEQAFVSACDSNNLALAERLLAVATAYMGEERFTTTDNPIILIKRNIWLTYGYKLKLISLLDEFKGQPLNFVNAAAEVDNPFKYEKCKTHEEKRQSMECNRFRSYTFAEAYIETEPQKCIKIMEKLCAENPESHYSYTLFRGRLASYEKSGDIALLRHALKEFFLGLGMTQPENLPISWNASILDAYRELRDQVGIDAHWKKLTPDQQSRAEVLLPYCRSLIDHGSQFQAQQIAIRFQTLNPQSTGNGTDDFIDRIAKSIPANLSSNELVQMVVEKSLRTVAQLSKHYGEILTADFEEYVTIVARGKQPHEFLKDIVQELGQELLLRRKNLQILTKHEPDRSSRKIAQEDLINDWFTSLFDKRMAEARIGFRDQKRAGQSGTGKSPGRVDGHITDSKNRRIAIFEAFRLFSKNTRVISEHLDKIAGYDAESLSPVFIVIYCDVDDFCALSLEYAAFIEKKEYKGFTSNPGGTKFERKIETDNLLLGMEYRHRNQEKVIFYHFLLNMRPAES